MSRDWTVATLPAGIALMAGEAVGLLDAWASSPGVVYVHYCSKAITTLRGADAA